MFSKIKAIHFINAILIFLLLWYWFSLPRELFKVPMSTIIEDTSNNLLAAQIADDGQWRFPENSVVPEKFAKALILFEDKRFYKHGGFDALALSRAFYQNFKAGEIVSGGSTITMQVIRASRSNPPRNMYEKIIEIILATRLELRYSKKKILSLYASHAPFGGNVVGLDAASWRYFGKSSNQMSWAEASLLAVLPNSPALIHPGKNRTLLLNKRNRLLQQLMNTNVIDSIAYSLALNEPLPDKPKPMPQLAPHLLTRLINDGKKGNRIITTIDLALQERISEIATYHYKKLRHNGIYNLGILVIEVESGNVLAYIGNSIDEEDEDNQHQVDMIMAKRSPGSTLKPLLFAMMVNDGELLPNQLVADIPTQIGSYCPQNINLTYDGAIPARRALARSLNVPAVRLLNKYGIEKFNFNLRRLGISTLNKPATHYGLSIILGGSEVMLWDMAGVYASMARVLNHFNNYNSRYSQKDWHAPVYDYKKQKKANEKDFYEQSSLLGAASIYATFEAMVDVSRPDIDQNWRYFSSTQKIAWKTGTSFGNRDAWALGCNKKYVVAVWAGNADGEGRPNLQGLTCAAPMLFDVFSLLPRNAWFDAPFDDMIKAAVCHHSGFRMSPACEKADTLWIPKIAENSAACPYHQIVHLDKTSQYRVHSECESIANMLHKKWFVLSPGMEHYFRFKNASYAVLPPYRKDCLNIDNSNNMELIYPKSIAKIFIPVDIDGKPGNVIFEIAHRHPETPVHWHIDNQYITSTNNFHNIAINLPYGKHQLIAIDQNGEVLTRDFEIINEKNK